MLKTAITKLEQEQAKEEDNARQERKIHKSKK